MTLVKTPDIIQYIADGVSVTPSDFADEFDISLDTARQRLKRLWKKDYLDREINPRETNYSIKTMTAHMVTNARAHLSKIIQFMKNTNDPALRLVPENKGGTNTGGGYTYQWRVLLEIMERMYKHETK